MSLKTESSTLEMIGNVSLTVMNSGLIVSCSAMLCSELESSVILPSMRFQVLKENLSCHQVSFMKQMLRKFGEVVRL